MNARSYRVNLTISPLDFPAFMGLGESSVSYQSEPHLDKKNLHLTITKTYILADMDTNKEYSVLSVRSDYEIPANLINTREDVYEFYKDALLNLNEVYKHAGTKIPELHKITFPTAPIEHYKREIDRVFNLLNQQN